MNISGSQWHYFRKWVIKYPEAYKALKITSRQAEIVKYVSVHGPVTTSDMKSCPHLEGFSLSNIGCYLKHLCDKGYMKRQARLPAKEGGYFVYSVPDALSKLIND